MSLVHPRLGQIFTPPAVVDLALALADLPPNPSVLDPSCGDGAFLARAVVAGVKARNLYGIDIDPGAVGAARARLPAGIRVELGDFLERAAAVRYDAVVGNPPYVRQEILDAATKRRVAEELGPDAGRADLALAFVARALRFVKPGGRIVFVLSSAVLDAGYGETLRRVLAGRARIAAIVASPRERWFPDADVHGVIMVIACDEAATKTRFARLRVPVVEAAARVTSLDDLERVADVRVAGDDDSWASLLRAPDIWFAARAAAGDHLVPLESLARIRRGVTSGANEFFYVPRATAHGIEERYLVPLLKTPREARAISLEVDSLATQAFVCHELPARGSGARAHIDKHAHLATRPTLASRDRWWALDARPARLFLTKAYAERFVQHLATRDVLPDQRVYALEPRAGVDLELLGAALNGTLTALALEALGRASMGQGALEWSVGDAGRLPVLDVRRLSRGVRPAFRALHSRTIGTVSAEAGATDRRALDRALLPPQLRALLQEMHMGLVGAVADRLARSR